MKTLHLPKVREAEFKDISDIVTILERAHEEFGTDEAPFCSDTTRNTLQRAINQREACVLLLLDGEEITGVMIGVAHQLWYSRTRQVSDIIYYVVPEGRGHGNKLITSYLGWARNLKNVGDIAIGITSGTPDAKRIDKMLKHFNMQPVGQNYRLTEVKEDVRNTQEHR